MISKTAAPNRRQFLAAFPAIIPASALGLQGATAPSDRIVMGCIGVGGMGSGHVRAFCQQPDVRVVAICDVRDAARESNRKAVNNAYRDESCAVYNDFRELLARKDIDAVLIAVPDHWHALIGLEAARNRKHMYYEKPMGVAVAEGAAMRAAVKRYGVVFQFGTQQRSSHYFRHACELVRNGRIGRLETILVGSASYTPIPNQPEQPTPQGFDYDMWLGPAPWAPYTAERCTRSFMLIYDYGLGCVSGAWGIHDIDFAQWVNESDHTAPVEVEATGNIPKDGLYNTALTWEAEHHYANGVKLLHVDRGTAVRRAPGRFRNSMGTLLEGSEGWIFVSRDGIWTQPESLATAVIGPNGKKVLRSDDHRRNFLNAIRTGDTPLSPIGAACNAEVICQQADIAMRLGRKLRWDPAKELFVGDEQANRMLTRPMRSPWHL
jgi:predicted dehydrogenase